MAKIVREEYANRNTIKQFLDDGKVRYICRGEHNPVAYYDNGVLCPIAVTDSEITSSVSVASINLKKKNKCSVGVRLDGSLTKYIGIRPDVCQDGSEQLEFSIESVKVNNKSISLSTLATTADKLSSIVDKYGDYAVVHTTRQGCRQMVKANNKVSSFVLTYRIYAKGLKLEYKKDFDEYWFFSEKSGDFRFRIRKPLFVDSATFEPLEIAGVENPHAFIKHSLIDQGDGTYLYTKESIVDLSKYAFPAEYYIDAETAWASTLDGYIYKSGSDYSEVHDATDGTVGSDSYSATLFVKVKGPSTYYIYRGFFEFNCVAISGTVDTVNLKLYGYNYDTATVMAQKGVQATTHTTADYDAFSGSTYGSFPSWKKGVYNTLALNATGISDVNSALGGVCKICCREYTYDYSNSTPSSEYVSGCYYANSSGTDKDPYLEITLAPAGVTVEADCDELSLDTYSATVKNNSVNAECEELSITANSATISADVSLTASCDPLTITTRGASVKLNASIAASCDSLTITGNPAYISADINVAASSDSLSVTEYSATVQYNVKTNIAASCDTLSISTKSATTKTDFNVLANVDGLTLSEHNAIIRASVNVNALTDSLTIIANSATVKVDTNLAASCEALTLRAYSCTVDDGLPSTLTDGIVIDLGSGLSYLVASGGNALIVDIGSGQKYLKAL